jgi:multiple sugar transport system substrate-binding protein
MAPLPLPSSLTLPKLALLLVAFTVILSACQLGAEEGAEPDAPEDAADGEGGSLTLATWGAEGEIEAFEEIIAAFEDENPDASVSLEVVPFGQFYEQLETRLAGGQAPDVTRIQYQQVGRYAEEGALVDLGDYLPEGYGDEFLPALWRAVQLEDRPYAVPHHTDTFALFYNVDYFEQAGIEPPATLDECWSWEEFTDVAQQVMDASDADYGFAMSWQDDNGYRWMPFLYMRGGQLLDDDFSEPMVATEEGIATIEWTQSWFEDGLVPPSTSLRSSEEVHNLFATGLIGMMLNGDWHIPFLEDNMTEYEYDVTYMPCDQGMASDLGGNALAVTRDSDSPELAARLVEFMASDEQMERFVTSATFIPVKESLLETELDYAQRPDVMEVFLEQADTIPDHMAQVQTLPETGDINRVLANELEQAFMGGQSPQETAENIDAGLEEALNE